MIAWPNKDPDEVLDYGFIWTDRLDGDTIVTSTWIVPAGITKDDEDNTTSMATVWLSGGTLGEKYEITNHIVTAGGRQMEQTARIAIKGK